MTSSFNTFLRIGEEEAGLMTIAPSLCSQRLGQAWGLPCTSMWIRGSHFSSRNPSPLQDGTMTVAPPGS